jgi:hypothetical protein
VKEKNEEKNWGERERRVRTAELEFFVLNVDI